jgi:hypothetical protein
LQRENLLDMDNKDTTRPQISSSTILLRQINPNWRSKKLQDKGRITSQAFRATKKDKKKVSVDNGDLTTAEDSYIHFTSVLRYLSIGVYGVTVSECSSLGLPVCPDPKPDRPSHTLIDLRGQSKSVSKGLLEKATDRGWLYLPLGSAQV